eukprot:gene12734-14039_t
MDGNNENNLGKVSDSAFVEEFSEKIAMESGKTKDDRFDDDVDNNKNDENEENNAHLNILDLPPEMILRIFIHVDIRTIFKQVILACKAFRRILTTEGVWKSIFSLKWERMRIAKDYAYVNDWKDVYFTYDDIHSVWKRKDKFSLKCKRMTHHMGALDAVHVMPCGDFAVAGSRDRSATIWDIRDFVASNDATEEPKQVALLSGFEGWVWAVTSNPGKGNEVITGAFDKKVKIWDLTRNGELIETYNYHPAAVLDIVCCDGSLFTACWDSKIRIFDPRSNDVQKLCHHRRPVLSLIVQDNMIISNSEDKTICICDRRMVSSKQVQKINLENQALCLNSGQDQGLNYLRAGGKDGTMNIFDTTDHVFTQLDSLHLWDTLKVFKIGNFQGAVIACAVTGFFKAYTPDRGMSLLGTFHEHTHDISSIHSRSRIMATGSCDNTIGFWKFCETS